MARIIFMGSPEYAIPSLKALVKHHHVLAVVTQPDKPVGRKKILTPPPVKLEAQKHGLKIFQPNKISEIYEDLKELGPDFIVTAAFGQFLPDNILKLPKFEALNLHGSILPKYRGGAPIQRAIMNLDIGTGVSLMRMVKKLDAGPVFNIKTTTIEDKTTGDLMQEMGELAADLLIESLPLIEAGSLKAVAQDERLVSYAKIISREDERIDFNQSAKQIQAQVRALSPSPLAYVDSNHGPIKLTQVHLSDLEGSPGEIIRVTSEGICVGTFDQSIWFTEGIPAGKSKMNLADFYRGHSDLRF